jgi:cell volume regulation protein A
MTISEFQARRPPGYGILPERKPGIEMEIAIFFLIIGAIILTGFIGMLINQRTKIPESLFLILFGLAIGPIFGIVESDALIEFVPIVSVAAMVVILVESGISFDIFKILGTFGTAVIFTVTVALLTTVLITIFLVYLFGWDPWHAALLGIISSGTTTITAMALLKGLDVVDEVRRLIMLETIINDFTIILGTFILIDVIRFSVFDISTAAKSLLSDFSVGVLLGLAFCFVWRYVLENINIKKELNYASTIGLCFVLYYIADTLGGNPIIAIFTFALVLGNYYKMYDFIRGGGEEKKDFNEVLRSIKSVQTDITFFMKSFFFVLLGITFDISILGNIPPLLIAGIILMILLSRFIASTLLSGMDKIFAKYRALITFMIPRGYVAAVLAFVPEQYGIEIPMFTDVVVILIVATTFVAIFGVAAFGKKKLAKKK